MQAMTPPAYEAHVETASTGAAIYRLNPSAAPAKLANDAPAAHERCRAVVVSGPAIQREEVRTALRATGFEIVMLDDTSMAVDSLLSLSPDVVVLDLTTRSDSALSLLTRCREADPQLPIVSIVASQDICGAVEAMRVGAFDVIEEAACRTRLQAMLDRAATQHRFNLESRSLKAVLERATGVSSVIRGESTAIRNLRETILRMAPKPVDATIIGETGTGKELVARCLHDFSMRTGHFVAINCAAIPENLFESELFGHEPGAYTGATRQRVGKLEYANGGTLFLDEIESLPLGLQAKLLRALQERQIERLGSNRPIPIDLRVVVATKVDLAQLAAEGSFRPDLYYRLNVLRLEIPPLRARLDDIPMLFEHFVQQAAVKFQQRPSVLTLELKQQLLAYPWPGNVRELRNAAERFQLGLPLALWPEEDQSSAVSLKTVLASVERALLQDSLQRHNGCVASASQALGLTAATFYRRLRAYGIATADHR